MAEENRADAGNIVPIRPGVVIQPDAVSPHPREQDAIAARPKHHDDPVFTNTLAALEAGFHIVAEELGEIERALLGSAADITAAGVDNFELIANVKEMRRQAMAALGRVCDAKRRDVS